ncbi:hypothetical protein J2X65_004880 [Ancylobacter sp. 3268]|uniref:hypothetical protein n=1 Tax=Ancylobacter sp. 3268 TaxID=2817752 RepID=UPI002858A43B|nr:hypothetical protein [Ancylobacter sp. 3268]MDR6955500.1 hypothetical protein [Ancylobacter sp. 3268]
MRRKDDAEAEERARRLAAALRENLKRRKAQSRGRDAAGPPAPPSDTPAGSDAPSPLSPAGEAED